MPYVPPSTVAPGQSYSATAHNIIVEDVIDHEARIVTNTVAIVPTGGILQFAGAAAPSGWLLCAGQVVNRADYLALYSVILTTYNTGGETTLQFRLPDLRGRVPAGLDNMGGSAASRINWATTLGTAGGAQTHQLTSGESGMPDHEHNMDSASFGGTGPDGYGSGGRVYIRGSDNSFGGSARALVTSNGQAFNWGIGVTGAKGGAQNASSGHNNMQPTILLNYIIKT